MNLFVNLKIFEEVNKSIAKSLADIKPLIPDLTTLIPRETFSQFEKIAKMNDLIATQISIPQSFFTQFNQIEILNQEISKQFKIPNLLIQQMQSVAEANKRLVEGFQIPSSTLSAIENFQRINLEHITQATSALNIIKQINTSFLSSINPIFNIGFNWNGFLDVISNSFKFTSEEDFKNFEYNWAGSLTIPELRELYQLWKNGEKEKVKDFFYEWFSDEKKIDNLIKDFNQNEIFTPRMHILSKALKAHLNSDYELSIPIILSQIDGIFIEKHKDLKDKISFTSNCKGCGIILKSKSHLTANSISKHILNKENEYLPFFLEHIIDTFENLRNDILHGKKLDYPDKNLSTKLILTLLELNFSK